MMDQFKVCYMPGGMGLDHSSWWLCESKIVQGVWMDWPIKRLRWSDYK
jgi:hypothetical protein